MKTLIGELVKENERFSLRYLLFEENDKDQLKSSFFNILVELHDNKHDEFAEARNFTGNRKLAERMLKRLSLGTVTPVGLPYIIEDYLADI